jgi:hypothetical protein
MNKPQSTPLSILPLLFILVSFCPIAGADSRDLIFEIDPSAFPGSFYRIVLDQNGDYVTGQGDGYGGGTWYYYPATGWWRQWFYNEPYDPAREGYLYYRVFITANDYSKTVDFEVYFNWTTPAWSQLGRSRPPLPDDVPTASDEYKYMDSESLQALDGVFLGTPSSPGSVEPNKEWVISQYNPEWVSIDIRGRNVDIHRGAMHECRAKDGSQPQQTTTLIDYGDAPDTYATTLASNGARHGISAGVYLGAGVTSETDGKPGASATGDAADDGVQFTSALLPGQTATLEVTASTQGYLNAWMDFNGDGSFDGDDEHIFDDARLASGVNRLSFRVPATATATDTYARFRFNTRGLLPYYGPAQDGEVEDYKVTLGTQLPQGHDVEFQPSAGIGGSKWSQPAQSSDAATPFIFRGWDEVSGLHLHQISADDWQCTDERPITGFRWWGSFDGWTKSMLPPVQPLAFHIGIWTDAPGKTADSNHPDTLLWETYCTHWTWSLAGQDDDPRGISQGESCFQFMCLLSQDEWFYQSPTVGSDGKSVPTVYWLSIAAVYDTAAPAPVNPWGWTTRAYSFNNAAARVSQVTVGNSRIGSWPPVVGARWLAGESVEYPKGTLWDLAFELLTDQGSSGGGQQSLDSDLAPIYRFWAEKLNSYFYTINEAEKDALIRDFSHVWRYEGIVFYAYPPERQAAGTKPVYRFWSGTLGRHFYTIDETEKKKLLDDPKVWTLEGVAWNTFERPPAK